MFIQLCTCDQFYDEAIQNCRQTYGVRHHLAPRLYFNKAIVYEDEAKKYPDDAVATYGAAYQHYKMAYVISRDLVGREHTKTVKYLETLREPTYQWFTDRDKENVEDLKVEDVEESLRACNPAQPEERQ